MYNDFSWNNENFSIDCRHFIGEKPCKFKRECKGCDTYSPMGFRILIIKLGAMGDVLRSTPLLRALKKKHPESHVTWLVDPASYDLVKNNPLIDSLRKYNMDSLLTLEAENYDLMICLEKETRAAALAEKITANKKIGFGLSPYGTIYPFNEESLYSFRLGVSDQLKFVENKKTYQEFVFEMAGMKFNNEDYILNTDDKDKSHAERIFDSNIYNKNNPVIGINPGAGSVFINKDWPVKNYIELIKLLKNKGDYNIALLGGKREQEKNDQIRAAVGDLIINTGEDNSLMQFSAIIDKCDFVICGDTLPMHIAIALKKYMLAIFGPTCEQEIDLYNRGRKVVATVECAPCYKRQCDIVENCMENIKVSQVYNTACEILSEMEK